MDDGDVICVIIGWFSLLFCTWLLRCSRCSYITTPMKCIIINEYLQRTSTLVTKLAVPNELVALQEYTPAWLVSTPVTFKLLVVLVSSGCFSAFVMVWVKLGAISTPSLYHEKEGSSLAVATHDKRKIASLLTISSADGLLVSSGGSDV